MSVYFTTKVADDAVFCDREIEREQIKNNISDVQHTVVVAPRRYGKTSLVCRALKESGLPFATTSLFSLTYDYEIYDKLSVAASSLIRSKMNLTEKSIKLLESCFKNIKITLSQGQFELSAERNEKTSILIMLKNLLNGLETFFKKHNEKGILFLDEFQDLLKIDDSSKIQAVIREAAQHSKHIVYIFSGSSSSMLARIFEDKTQPLYMLCNKLTLGRINAKDFGKHIKKAFKATFKQNTEQEILDKIFELTELHTYYVNLLCSKLIRGKTIPTLSDITETWIACQQEVRGKLISDLEKLNLNRMKTLKAIAHLGEVKQPNSQAFLLEVQLSLGSVQKAVQYLIEQDYVYTRNDGLTLVDPALKYFLTSLN